MSSNVDQSVVVYAVLHASSWLMKFVDSFSFFLWAFDILCVPHQAGLELWEQTDCIVQCPGESWCLHPDGTAGDLLEKRRETGLDLWGGHDTSLPAWPYRDCTIPHHQGFRFCSVGHCCWVILYVLLNSCVFCAFQANSRDFPDWETGQIERCSHAVNSLDMPFARWSHGNSEALSSCHYLNRNHHILIYTWLLMSVSHIRLLSQQAVSETGQTLVVDQTQ